VPAAEGRAFARAVNRPVRALVTALAWAPRFRRRASSGAALRAIAITAWGAALWDREANHSLGPRARRGSRQRRHARRFRRLSAAGGSVCWSTRHLLRAPLSTRARSADARSRGLSLLAAMSCAAEHGLIGCDW